MGKLSYEEMLQETIGVEREKLYGFMILEEEDEELDDYLMNRCALPHMEEINPEELNDTIESIFPPDSIEESYQSEIDRMINTVGTITIDELLED